MSRRRHLVILLIQSETSDYTPAGTPQTEPDKTIGPQIFATCGKVNAKAEN